MDVNPEMIIAARQFVPNGDFRKSTAEALPYPDASFDLVFFGLVLHESDEPLKSCKKPSGYPASGCASWNGLIRKGSLGLPWCTA